MASGHFIQFGAGYSAPAGWLNFDSSPTVRIKKIPVVGGLLSKIANDPLAFPDTLQSGDIVRGLPVEAGSAAGLYASHVLEHLSREDMRIALKNSFEMLQPGGIFRLIVPDLLERARRYVDAASQGDAEASHRFMESTFLGRETTPKRLDWVKLQLNNAHLWMWDYESMAAELKNAGFVGIRRAAIGDSGEPMFDRVEVPGRFVDDGIAEVAIEARKP